jgi:hypothetical protein
MRLSVPTSCRQVLSINVAHSADRHTRGGVAAGGDKRYLSDKIRAMYVV